MSQCFKCGAEIKPHHSAYTSWDESILIKWTPSSDDEDNIDIADSGGKHPNIITYEFCSEECLDDFVSMDYSIGPSDE